MFGLLMDVVYVAEIVIGLGLLIFIHELGHFLMAKRNGVRVEAFSLGMGPILWKRTWGETEYRISAIPLGGYVKMAGENIGDPRTGKPDELTSKNAWQRLQIFSAGALMNLIIAFPIAMLAFWAGLYVHVPEIAIPGPAEAAGGMKPGDVIVEIDGRPVERFEQYRMEMIGRSQGSIVPVKVMRKGESQPIELKIPQSGSDRHAMTTPLQTTVAAVRERSPAWEAGLRPKDVIVRIEDPEKGGRVDVYTAAQILEILKGAPDRKIAFFVKREKEAGERKIEVMMPAKREVSWPEDARMMEAVVKAVSAGSPADVDYEGQSFLAEGDKVVQIGDTPIRHWKDLKTVVERSAAVPLAVTRERDGGRAAKEIVPAYNPLGKGMLGIVPLPTKTIVEVAEDSWYYEKGLRSGDRVEAVDDEKGVLTSGEVGVQDIFKLRPGRASIRVQIERDGKMITLEVKGREGPVGDIEGLGLGAAGAQIAIELNMRFSRWSVGEAARDAIREPVRITQLTFQTLGKLVFGQESVKNLSGVVGIFQASFLHARLGLGNLLFLLLVITVNLGVFNLLPIPVLDGGHVLLLGIEKLRGAPPSPRFIERFQVVGVVFLLALIVLTLYNDFSRILRG
ncbi:MAG: RIP metalloprotease RseP [Planctomycetes bacterium]|nr:RIP metalloprotease RseP [Planctomycetota bacterium]